MADVAAVAQGVVAKKPKVARKPAVHAAHPPFADMIIETIKQLKDRHGSSRQAIIKHIKANYKVDGKVVDVQVRRWLVQGTASGKLVRTKGVGASGSFKLSESAKVVKKVAKKTAAKPKKVVAKKAAKPKKPASVKKVVAKPKTVKKVKPVKAKKAATKPKKPVVKKTPKKIVKK